MFRERQRNLQNRKRCFSMKRFNKKLKIDTSGIFKEKNEKKTMTVIESSKNHINLPL